MPSSLNNPALNFVLDTRHLRQFHDCMIEQNIFLVYEGDFNKDVIKSLLAIVERMRITEFLDEFAIRKIYYVMIESLRNICKYQLKDGLVADELQAVFMLGISSEGISVISGNPVTHQRMEMLREKLDYINGLDSDSIRTLYKNARLGGAGSSLVERGLGFIDMAKRTGKKLHYQFEEINSEYAYFTFMVTVPNEQNKNNT